MSRLWRMTLHSVSPFVRAHEGRRACGEDHLYRSDCVIFYTNGRLACGPRVLQVGHHRRRFRSKRKSRLLLITKSRRFGRFIDDIMGYPF